MRVVNIPGQHDVLYYIGRHLPLWEWVSNEDDDGSNVNGRFVFKPRVITICLQVCRYWQTTMRPILWHTYTSEAFMSVPNAIVQRNSKYLKALETHQGHFGPYDCTEIVDLFLTPQRPYSRDQPGVDLRQQMMLLRKNKGLKALYWLGEDPRVMMDVDGLSLQKHLIQLIMINWDGGDGRLVRVLQAISGTIKRLGLFTFFNVHEGDLLLKPSKKSSISKTTTKKGQEHDDGREGAVMLPQVETLTFNINNHRSMGLIDLLRCCPKLTDLSVNCSADDISRLIFNIQHYSPNIDKLKITDSAHHSPETIIALLRASRRGRSLEDLNVGLSGLEDGVTSAIIAHAGTLETLELTIDNPKPLNLVSFMRIMAKCTKLKSFRCRTNSETTNQSVLKALGSQEWGCKELTYLGLAVNSPGNWPKSDLGLSQGGLKLDRWEDEGNVDREEFVRDMAELKEISKNKSAMGWRVWGRPEEGDKEITPHDRRLLRALFRLVADKDKLEVIQWGDFTFKRTSASTKNIH
ncbi:hypothetical protein BGX33_001566 [Mortierella sp. NVP41]|nr:hypothetical protein BGX33_001566 [Mortierella sp. NVP41]